VWGDTTNISWLSGTYSIRSSFSLSRALWLSGWVILVLLLLLLLVPLWSLEDHRTSLPAFAAAAAADTPGGREEKKRSAKEK
jgi:hypothetical protein